MTRSQANEILHLMDAWGEATRAAAGSRAHAAHASPDGSERALRDRLAAESERNEETLRVRLLALVEGMIDR